MAGAKLTPRLWLVTRGAQAIGRQDSMLDAAQTPLWGLGRVIALEHPELRCTRIDLDPAAEEAVAVEQLIEEMLERGPRGSNRLSSEHSTRGPARPAWASLPKARPSRPHRVPLGAARLRQPGRLPADADCPPATLAPAKWKWPWRRPG